MRSAYLSTIFGASSLMFVALLSAPPVLSAEDGRVIPAPVSDIEARSGRQTAIFAGGCFWGVQGVFQHVEGVTNATSGYAGGSQAQAVYDVVSSGTTGHAEAVKIDYDPQKVSYGHLLQIYFSVAHDPTQLDRQGPDTGSQYRSAIFPQNEEQAKVARAYIGQLNKAGVFGKIVVTKVESGKHFFPAEAYHQDFLTNNPTYPYIVYNDLPKIEALKALFPKDFRAKPVLVANAGKK